MLAWILKTKPEKRASSGRTSPSAAMRGAGPRGEVDKAVEQELDAEVVGGAAEEDGGEAAGEHGRVVEGVAGAVEHLDLVAGAGEGVGRSICDSTKASWSPPTCTGAR
jgi:hypothetical protein